MSIKSVVLSCAAMSLAVGFGGEGTSESTFVLLNTNANSFWRTATNRTVTVPIDLPLNATAANLSVRGTRYAKVYEAIVEPSFTFDLPAADDMSKEDVYELTLTFVGNPTVRTARLALVSGQESGASGRTRVLSDKSGKWKTAYGFGVLPVPQGAVLAVDGETVEVGDKGFTGAQGWYALGKLPQGQTTDLLLTVDGTAYPADGLSTYHLGSLLLFR